MHTSKFSVALFPLLLLSQGCVLTDYPEVDPSLNESPALIGCLDGRFFEGTTTTTVPDTQRMLYSALDPESRGALCVGNTPVSSGFPVTRRDAMTWNFCLAAWARVAEVQVFDDSPNGGLWALGGVKDLEDGRRRLNTYHSPDPSRFTCVGAGLDPSGPEGTVAGDGYPDRRDPDTPRIPNLRIEAVALDGKLGCQMCSNVVAVKPDRFEEGFSTFTCQGTRAAENRLHSVPPCRRSGLEDVLSGRSVHFSLGEVDVTARSGITPDGRVEVELQALSSGGVGYASDDPVRFLVDPNAGLRRVEVHPPAGELDRLARFALDAGLVDRPLSLPPEIPELGLPLPDYTFLVSGAALERRLAAR